MAKLKSAKILAGFLAFMMVVGMLPISVFTTVFAAGIDSYSVRLTDEVSEVLNLDDVEVTMTQKDDTSVTNTVKTVDGVAEFEQFVEIGSSYTVSVSDILGYESVDPVEVTVGEESVSTDIQLQALQKITISGVVTDETGTAYEGAKVEVGGYVTFNTTTDETGAYTFETYAGKGNTITISPKEEDKQYHVINVTATYNENTSDADHQFEVKTFDIQTSAGENGTITSSEDNVPYGADRSITIQANEGYRIQEIIVDGEAVNGAKDQTEYSVVLNAIDANHSITASFYKATYTVSFDVSANGEVQYNSDEVALGGQVTNVTVEENSSVTFEAIANSENGYHVEKVSIGDEVALADGDNKDVSFMGTVSSDEINTTVLVTVVFAINQYTVTLENTEHSQVVLDDKDGNTSATELTVNHGEPVYIQVVPDEHYDLQSITVGGTAVDFVETANGYESLGVNITSDVVVDVAMVEKEPAREDSYVMTLPEEGSTVGGDYLRGGRRHGDVCACA